MRQGNLREDLTYWAPAASNEFGHAGSAAGVAIKGRWEDRTTQVRSPSGEEITSSAVVYVDTDVLIGGFLVQGITAVGTASPTSDAKEIQVYETIPDLRNNKKQRKAYL